MLKKLLIKNKSNYLKLIQQGGNYPIYRHLTREYIDNLKLVDTKATEVLIEKAKTANRYYIKNKNINEGIDSANGPRDFDMATYKKENNVNIDIDQYESTIIWQKLEEMNNIITDVQTIQSGIAYYEDIPTFSPPYLQVPFVEFVTPGKYWIVVKVIMGYVKQKYKYRSTVYYCNHDLSHISEPTFDASIRFCILRSSYINEDGLTVTDVFDDQLFFENIITCLTFVKTLINRRKIELKLPEKGKPNDIDESKNIYYITKDGHVNEYVPYTHPIDGTPLTSLVVRNTDNFNAFVI